MRRRIVLAGIMVVFAAAAFGEPTDDQINAAKKQGEQALLDLRATATNYSNIARINFLIATVQPRGSRAAKGAELGLSEDRLTRLAFQDLPPSSAEKNRALEAYYAAGNQGASLIGKYCPAANTNVAQTIEFYETVRNNVVPTPENQDILSGIMAHLSFLTEAQ